MTIRLRTHHLLCMLTFTNEGYTPAFVRNFEEIARRISAGQEIIEIVEGPDDICSPLLAEQDCHCHNASVAIRDHRASESLSLLFERPIQPSERILLDHETLSIMRKAFVTGRIRSACEGCQWSRLCDAIAENCFERTVLLGLNRPRSCHD